MTVIGVSTPDFRAIAKDVVRRLKAELPDVVLSLAHALIEINYFEGYFVVYEIISRHRPTMASLDLKGLERLGRGWTTGRRSIRFSTLVSGPVWMKGQISDDDIVGWAQSDDL